MSQQVIILGGGVAGLSAANRLAERGAAVTLVEANTYPQHKVCGEFLSPEALPILEQWDIPVGAVITHVMLHQEQQRMTYRFPTPSGSCSRYELDHHLAQRAAARGVVLRTESRVDRVEPSSGGSAPHRVYLAGGDRLTGDRLIISTGRLLSQVLQRALPVMAYVGFKAHFRSDQQCDRLDMHCFNGGYLGVSPLGPGTVNAACLVRRNVYERAGSPAALVQHIQKADPADASLRLLRAENMVFDGWLTTRMPPLRRQTPPAWPQTYFLGDAMGSIYPATGDGLAMALTSGCSVADYALAGDASGYRRAWHQRYAARLRWGNRLHHLMLSPALTRAAFRLCTLLPRIPDAVFRGTREDAVRKPET